MAFYLLVLMLLSLAILGLSLGVLFGRAPLRGSCGGLSCGGACVTCPRRSTHREEENSDE